MDYYKKYVIYKLKKYLNMDGYAYEKDGLYFNYDKKLISENGRHIINLDITNLDNLDIFDEYFEKNCEKIWMDIEYFRKIHNELDAKMNIYLDAIEKVRYEIKNITKSVQKICNNKELSQQYLLKNREKLSEFKNVLIWSNEHQAWWRSNGRGYTNQLSEAGIYDINDAWSKVAHCGPEKAIIIQSVD